MSKNNDHPFGWGLVGQYLILPDSTRLHEGESALHEEDDDRHDKEEKVIDFLRFVHVDIVAVVLAHLPWLNVVTAIVELTHIENSVKILVNKTGVINDPLGQ